MKSVALLIFIFGSLQLNAIAANSSTFEGCHYITTATIVLSSYAQDRLKKKSSSSASCLTEDIVICRATMECDMVTDKSGWADTLDSYQATCLGVNKECPTDPNKCANDTTFSEGPDESIPTGLRQSNKGNGSNQ